MPTIYPTYAAVFFVHICVGYSGVWSGDSIVGIWGVKVALTGAGAFDLIVCQFITMLYCLER
jgi:hypothetical protein